MKKNSSTTNIIPSLVLTVGSSLISSIADAQHILLENDPRRKATMQFLSLKAYTHKTELVSFKYKKEKIPIPSMTRQQVSEQVGKSIGELAKKFRSALHELRTHEKLIEVGLGEKSNLPLTIILIADLAEPDAASVEAIFRLMQTILEPEPYARICMLFNIAIFNEDSVSVENVHIGLKSIQAMLETGQFSTYPQVYLFDRYKEGVWEAKDDSEIQTIIGNFLIALLSGGLAQHLAHQVSQADLMERKAYFYGASASALMFDVNLLQKVCAMKLGAEILEAEFSSQVIPDPVPINEMVSTFIGSHANLNEWTNHLCRDSVFQVLPGTADIELHFSDLQFENIIVQDWKEIIKTYDFTFKQTLYPLQINILNKNVDGVSREFLNVMSKFIETLPQQSRLYPGGVRASLMVIESLRKVMVSTQGPLQDLAAIENECNTKIDIGLRRLEHHIDTLPTPPQWLLRLPKFLRSPALQLFNLIFLYRELNELTTIRQECVRLIEQKYETLVKEEIARRLTALSQSWLEALGKHTKTITHLQSMLDRLQQQLNSNSHTLTSSTSQFRQFVFDDSILAWAHYYGDRPQEGFFQKLLIDQSFFQKWQHIDIKTLKERLRRFCLDIYKPLSNVTLEEALRHSNRKDVEMLASTLMQSTVPLLRPNFDRAGSSPSFQLRFFQCWDPLSSSLLPSIKKETQEWEMISTDDQFLAIFCRVRMLIPESAIEHILLRRETLQKS
ncbi:MAG: hypothetical protein KF758_17015 [Anaerolineales bacterium]|nr:hypothetical protein [Anaerolineales bacterium]